MVTVYGQFIKYCESHEVRNAISKYIYIPYYVFENISYVN